MARWQADAAKGDDWAADQLLSRPDLDAEAEPYWHAFLALSRDRQFDSLSLGMGGGVRIPCVITRETIRREGERQGYDGEDLDDFVEIVTGIDDAFLAIEMQRIADDTKKQAGKMKKGGGNGG